MTTNPPDKSIFSIIPLADIHQMRICIEAGYSVASELIDSCDFLQVPSAKSRHQDIYNFASDFCIAKQCDEGRLNFASSFLHNEAKNCKHLQIQNNSAIITFCSVNSPTALPRSSVFRKDLSFSNQMSFEDFIRGNNILAEPKYFIVTHQRIYKSGVYVPSLHLGIPDREYQKWNNLYGIDEIQKLNQSDEVHLGVADTLDISVKKELIDTLKHALA